MGYSRKYRTLVSLFLLFFTMIASADNGSDLKRTEAEKTSGTSPNSVDSVTSLEKIIIPEDTTHRFLVRELKISGNKLLLTKELLYTLPYAYIVSMEEEDKPVKQKYDFRVLHELIRHPGTVQEVSVKTIQGLTKYILSVYQEKGYAGIYVYVPAEAVNDETEFVDGILPVKVLEGTIAEISVAWFDFNRDPKDKGFLKSSALKSWSPVKEGDVIQKKELDDFVRLLNLNPDRYVSPVISRSIEPNALNLSYDVYETNPWHWYIQADDSGTKDRQWNPRVGFINTNLSGVDDRFSVMYQAPWEKGIEDEYAVFGSYDFPVITPRLRLNVYSGYSQFDVLAADINFLGNGSFYGSKLSYNLFQTHGWFVDIIGSLSHERSKVTPSIGLTSDVDMELWGLGMNAHYSSDMSNTSLVFSRTESMGGSSTSRFEDARVDTEPDFTIFSFAASHSQYLDKDKANRITGSFRSITPNKRLVPAKMTTFGGLYSVRGYKEDEIVADGGLLISVQYEYDMIRRGTDQKNQKNNELQKRIQEPLLKKFAPLAFIDFGRAKIKHPIASEEKVRELCSIGIGTKIEVGDDFNAELYYGWPLRATEETDTGQGRLNMSFIVRF